jgi:hypothetical protein
VRTLSCSVENLTNVSVVTGAADVQTADRTCASNRGRNSLPARAAWIFLSGLPGATGRSKEGRRGRRARVASLRRPVGLRSLAAGGDARFDACESLWLGPSASRKKRSAATSDRGVATAKAKRESEPSEVAVEITNWRQGTVEGLSSSPGSRRGRSQ